MFLAPKTKGLVVDHGEQSVHVGVVSSFPPPCILEAVHECAPGIDGGFAALISSLRPPKGSAYLRGPCAFTPPGRFVRRAALDLKRAKESDYLSEIATSQFRIEVDKNKIAVLSAFDGYEFEATSPSASREVVFAGMPEAEASQHQASLLASGVYPDKLELSSLSAIGALVDYFKFTESAKPTLMLELGADTTHSYIVSNRGLEATRPIQVGLDAMVPVVQKELGLKDEESARKLFFSNTFDFTGMGAVLCKRLLKELQSSMGFYEVQTGQSIGQLVCPVLPGKLAWLESVLALQIGVGLLTPEYEPWLAARGISIGSDLKAKGLSARHLGLLGLLLVPKSTPPSSHGEAVQQ